MSHRADYTRVSPAHRQLWLIFKPLDGCTIETQQHQGVVAGSNCVYNWLHRTKVEGDVTRCFYTHMYRRRWAWTCIKGISQGPWVRAMEHVTDISYLSCMCRENKPFAVWKWLDNIFGNRLFSLFRLLTAIEEPRLLWIGPMHSNVKYATTLLSSLSETDSTDRYVGLML